MEQRKELMYERLTLPSRFWEQQADEEELIRLLVEADEDVELPFEKGFAVAEEAPAFSVNLRELLD